MTELKQTVVFAAAAAALLLATWVSAPRLQDPALFQERGQLFFPDFVDPNVANSLEVVQFDEQNGLLQPLKVMNQGGVWVIPSLYGYPADAKDRLAETAAAIVALRKDDVGSDRPGDQESCGVVDPVDATRPGAKGRGTRITIRGQNERLLADIIVGREVEGHAGYRYVRVPGQNRIYLSGVGHLEVSTTLADWIDRDLLQVDRDEIDAIYLRSYSLDERSRQVRAGESLAVRKNPSGSWAITGMQPGELVDEARMNRLLDTVETLRIATVLPKPAGISAALSGKSERASIAAADRDDLARKGFYFTADGELVSNEGELVVHTSSGLFYTLRFGEVAPAPVTAAASGVRADANAPAERPSSGEHRYLFIMAGFETPSERSPAAAAGEKRAATLRGRFAPWYYVISSGEFASLRVRRAELLRRKGALDTGASGRP